MKSNANHQAGLRPLSNRSGTEEGQVTCPDCGAGFSVDEPRCPYCGALNPSGAEKAYMNELAEINEDVAELADDAQEDFRASLRGNARRTVVIVVIVVAALAAMFLASNCIGKGQERHAVQEFQTRESFRAQHFDEFDRLYEAGDDDALSEYAWSLMDDPGFDALFSWEHIGLLQAHDAWEALRSTADRIGAGECKLDDYVWSVSLALRLAQFDTSDRTLGAALSPEDEKRAAVYRAYGRQFLQNVLQMSDDEIAAFADEAKDSDGYVQEKKLKHNLEVRLKQLGTSF